MVLQHDADHEAISIEQFFALVESDPEHRYELIGGYPYLMTGGSPDHSIIGANLNRILGEHLRQRPCIVYNSDVYVELADETSCLCPDASVSCDRRDRYAARATHYPCLIAEVLSPTTKAHDQGIKADLYQGIPSVQEILFIDTKVMRIKLYQRETDHWTMLHFTNNDEIIDLKHLGIRFSVAEVYEKTTFDEAFAEA